MAKEYPSRVLPKKAEWESRNCLLICNFFSMQKHYYLALKIRMIGLAMKVASTMHTRVSGIR